MSDDIVNAIMIKGSIKELENKIEKFNKSAFWLSFTIVLLTTVMVIEVGIQIWIAIKK